MPPDNRRISAGTTPESSSPPASAKKTVTAMITNHLTDENGGLCVIP